MSNDPVPAPPEGMEKPGNEKPESTPNAAAEATALPAIPLAERVDPAEAIAWDVPLLPVFEEETAPPAPASPLPAACPACQAPRGPQHYCEDCGFIFAFCDEAPAVPAEPDLPTAYLQGRYELGQLLNQRGGVFRYRGLDHGDGTGAPVPVVLLRAKVPPSAPSPSEAADVPAATPLAEDEMIAPALDLGPDATEPITANLVNPATWPSIAWEEVLLETTAETLLPSVRDGFIEGDWEYLVEEWPSGRPLWDAWDDPEATAAQRFGWLRQLAEGLNRLHRAGVILESLRPEMVVLSPEGQPRLTDLSELLPWPLPPDAPLRPSLATAPELVVSPDTADARADLYAFGALLYALHVGRELTETDFDGPGFPRPFLAQFPDAHPTLGRLLAKTFCRAVEARFPTDEAFREDPTGFTDLVRMLDVCSRTLDHVRLEVGAWTTTGMARTGNEDAFALLHAVEARQDDLGESALILLADGMGGYEAGEVAAALAIQVMRRYLLEQPLFAPLAGAPVAAGASFDLSLCQYLLGRALKEANREVFQAARCEWGRHGMGCTAEALYVNGRHVVVGHVGDSRTYHLHEGRLVQLTRDQTLVNRLVELGTLTPAEAEKHPRRSELQQAIGGHAEVDPALYHGILKPGDWVVVCSDGLSNHVTPRELQQMLQSEATSAEMAARRLVNLANIKGALDNATVVVVRAL
jgi:serine/threonine protein phosphatase PrpC